MEDGRPEVGGRRREEQVLFYFIFFFFFFLLQCQADVVSKKVQQQHPATDTFIAKEENLQKDEPNTGTVSDLY